MTTDATPSTPFHTLVAALTACPADADAWIAVHAVHSALCRDLYAAHPDIAISAVERVHAVLTAAYSIVGGHVARDRHGAGYYHALALADAIRLLG